MRRCLYSFDHIHGQWFWPTHRRCDPRLGRQLLRDYLHGQADVGYGYGVVYKVDTAGHATVLHNFTNGADGGNPYGGVIRDSSRQSLRHYCGGGGASGAGVVFKIDPSGNETVLYSFTGGTDGGYPLDGVIRDPAGNLYGTTSGGGASGAGVVFKVDPSGNETVLYSFTGGSDGGSPMVV